MKETESPSTTLISKQDNRPVKRYLISKAAIETVCEKVGYSAAMVGGACIAFSLLPFGVAAAIVAGGLVLAQA